MSSIQKITMTPEKIASEIFRILAIQSKHEAECMAVGYENCFGPVFQNCLLQDLAMDVLGVPKDTFSYETCSGFSRDWLHEIIYDTISENLDFDDCAKRIVLELDKLQNNCKSE